MLQRQICLKNQKWLNYNPLLHILTALVVKRSLKYYLDYLC